MIIDIVMKTIISLIVIAGLWVGMESYWSYEDREDADGDPEIRRRRRKGIW